MDCWQVSVLRERQTEGERGNCRGRAADGSLEPKSTCFEILHLNVF